MPWKHVDSLDTPLPRDPQLSPREVHVGRDAETGEEYLLETFWSDGVPVERRLSTRPDPAATWSPPIALAGVANGAPR